MVFLTLAYGLVEITRNSTMLHLVNCTILGMCVILFTFSSLYTLFRKAYYPMLVTLVNEGMDAIYYVQQFKCRSLDFIMEFSSFSVSPEFYVTFLSFLFWTGEVKLGMHLSSLMTCCLFFGNGWKDLMSAPRPVHKDSNITNAVTKSKGPFGTQEYGFPSTHTVNSLCLYGYLLYSVSDRGLISLSTGYVLQIAVISWVSLICFGRMYLGMHTPVDLLGGGTLGMSLLSLWINSEDTLDWLLGLKGTDTKLHVFAFPAVIVFVMFVCYPLPVDRTPSHSYLLDFGTSLIGEMIGIWRNPMLPGDTASSLLPSMINSQTALSVAPKVLLRMVLGMAILITFKTIAKMVGKSLTHVLREWAQSVVGLQPLINRSPSRQERLYKHANRATEAQRTKTECFFRCIEYGVVGWSSMDAANTVFRWLGV